MEVNISPVNDFFGLGLQYKSIFSIFWTLVEIVEATCFPFEYDPKVLQFEIWQDLFRNFTDSLST